MRLRLVSRAAARRKWQSILAARPAAPVSGIGGGRHSLIPIAGIMMLVLGLILLAQAKGYVELRNLASTPALVWIGEILDRLGLR